jgi:hypothetical protein
MAYIVEGIRKGKVLAYDGYLYEKNRAYKDMIYWRCSDKVCRAPLKTNFVDLDNPPSVVGVYYVRTHVEHMPNYEEVEQLKTVNYIKGGYRCFLAES